MTRLPFIVTHDGMSAYCALHVDRAQQVKLIELIPPPGHLAVFGHALSKRIEMLNDLIHAEMPFDALASCRRSPGLFGAILDPAATALENFRAIIKGSADAAGT